MIVAIVPAVFALAGALLWLLSSNATAKEMGKILFAVGVFWLCYGFVGKVVHIG